jgi:hypothetical protein
MRSVTTSLLLIFFAATVVADDEKEEPKGPIKLVVDPAKEPVPKLRYRLLPPPADLETGNAANTYRRGFIPLSEHFKDSRDKIDEWVDKPLDALAKHRAEFNFPVLLPIDRAARMSHVDWDITKEILARGNLEIIDAEHSSARAAMQLIRIRSRIALLEGEFDEALRSYQTALAMAQHFGQAAGFSMHITAAMIGEMSADELQLFLQRPGAPNLYWALRAMPKPLFPVVSGLEIDFRASERYMRLPPAIANEILSEAEAQLAFEAFHVQAEKFGSMGHVDKLTPEQIKAGKVVQKLLLAENEKTLRQAGRSEGDIKKMTPAQVYLLAALYHHRAVIDEILVLHTLPYAEAISKTTALHNGLRERALKNTTFAFTAVLLSPGSGHPLTNQAKVERRFALLTTLEALRLHAAEKGVFPEKLADAVVPIPHDPITGQAFHYENKGGVVTLRSPSTTGLLRLRGRADREYELRLRTK